MPRGAARKPPNNGAPEFQVLTQKDLQVLSGRTPPGTVFSGRTPSLAEALSRAEKVLAQVTDTPRIDAEILLAHFLELNRAQLLARLGESRDLTGFDALLDRRLSYEPIAYILGEWEFFSLRFFVEPPALVPRPETEHLVECVLESIGGRASRVLELGTGTGCVAAAIAHNAPECSVLATDIREERLALARRNVALHGLTGRIAFAVGDLFDAVPENAPPFDVVCSNPPYIEEDAWPELSPVIRLHEDPRALLAGHDGLAVIRRLVAGARRRLTPGGLLAFEIGMGQYRQVCGLLEENGYSEVAFRKDLAGIERVAIGRLPGGRVANCAARRVIGSRDIGTMSGLT